MSSSPLAIDSFTATWALEASAFSAPQLAVEAFEANPALAVESFATNWSVPIMASSVFHRVAAAGVNALVIKSSPGTVTGWKVYNNSNFPIFVKLYDSNVAPAPDTDTPKQTIGINAGLGDLCPPSTGLSYANGIAIAIVLGIADNDNAAVGANSCVIDIFYQ